MRKQKNNFSVKKVDAFIGSKVFYFLCIWVVIVDPNLIQFIVWPLVGLVAAIYGIKKFGYIGQPNDEPPKDEGEK